VKRVFVKIVSVLLAWRICSAEKTQELKATQTTQTNQTAQPSQTNENSILIGGVEYHDVRFGDVTLESVTVFHRSGVMRIRPSELPAEWQKRLGVNTRKAEAPEKPSNGDGAKSDKKTGESPWQIMSDAESALRVSDFASATIRLNSIVEQFPQSHEAGTLRTLTSMLRDKEPGKTGSLTVEEIVHVKKMIDAFETIARGYQSAPVEKRQAIDTIFGPGTFDVPNRSLEGVLNATIQMEAARRKALRGE
jgi:hypothetical protein